MRVEIRTIVLAGSPMEMGLRHGELLGDEIRLLVGQVRHLVFGRVGRVRGIGLRILLLTLARSMGRHMPPHLREEMSGISSGSGVNFSDLLILNTLDDALNLLRRWAPRTPSLACSGFVLFGTRTHDGSLMHGRNLDYHFRGTPLDDGGEVSRLLRRQVVLFVFHPRGRASFVSVGWPGLVGTQTAMNREGISLANLTSFLRGTTPNGVPTALLYRRVAEEASTLREARELIGGARRTIGNNLLLGSGRENTAALLEITRGLVVEVPPEDGMLVATNHFRSPELALRQRPSLLGHSVVRWKRLRELCDRRGMTVEDALGFLADVGCADPDYACNPFARVANEGTAVSVLLRPATLELWLGVNSEPPASGGEFRRIDAAILLTGNPNHQDTKNTKVHEEEKGSRD